MNWNYAPEIISACYLMVILVYSVRYRLVPNRRNRMFFNMVGAVLVLVILSLATVLLSSHPDWAPYSIDMVVHTLFFIAYPIVPILFLWYLIAVIFDLQDTAYLRLMVLTYLPKLGYDLIVLANPMSHYLFVINDQGYVPGLGEFAIFVIAIFYMIAIFVLAIRYNKALSRPLALIIMVYNLIFIAFLIIEYFVPQLVLGGTAAALFILILYLYIQNREAMTDRLTNLLNRQSAVERLHLLEKSRQPASLILVSLSDFKTVNSLYGQQAGNAFLALVADTLVSISRVDEVYRYAGDKFLLILNQDYPRGKQILTQLIDRFDQPFICQGNTTTLRAKFTQVLIPDHARTTEEAVALIEYLSEKVRQNPKQNQIQSSEASLSTMNRRSAVLEVLKTAVAEDRFTLAIQPILSIQNSAFLKAEALLRLTDDRLGTISPSEFIPMAEEAGLIIKIGEWVTAKTLAFIQSCNDEGLYLDSISVNISADHMSQEGMVDVLSKQLEATKVFPSQLKLEITESIFIHDYSQIIANIEALRLKGIGLYLDDFGTGFSNFTSVIKLPLDLIKFDRSLILEAQTNPKTKTMVQGLIQMFKANGWPTLAEGVETEAQEAMVKEMGFDEIQGYLKSKPLTSDQFKALLKKQTVKK